MIDSCGRTYRLQTHHIIPQKNGGPHTAENLVTLEPLSRPVFVGEFFVCDFYWRS
ncbi:MAG: HNH endonuclease, partial [Acidimicrobiia bacterium]|nr:HNH endonuclease [Acidimicrobiia bacterium]